MTSTLHNLIARRVDALLPLPLHLQERSAGLIQQVLAEGYADEAVAMERYSELVAADAELRDAAARRQATVTLVEHALALGAMYDGVRDTWAPPAGMTMEDLIAAIGDRLR